MTTDKASPTDLLALKLNEGLGPLVEVLARWEDQNGTMAAILPSEWDALKQDVMDACVLQPPRMLRSEIARLHVSNEHIAAGLGAAEEDRDKLHAQLAIAARGLKHCAGWNISDDTRNALLAVVIESEALLLNSGPNVEAKAQAPVLR